MLLLQINPVYIRCGLLLQETKELNEEINAINNQFTYFELPLLIHYNKMLLMFLKINFFGVDEFKKSIDYDFIMGKLGLKQSLNEEDRSNEKIILTKHKDSITILNSPRNKNPYLPFCYYCGHLTGQKEMIILELFKMKCIKGGHENHLSILGIDYIATHIEDSFFNLPSESVSSMIQVSKGIKKVTEKHKLSLKDKLYPYLMSNILEGVSVYRVDSIDNYTRIGGTAFGITSWWSLVSLSCKYEDPEKAINDALAGDNELIDLSVGDIYGGKYDQFNLDANLIASSFGKLKYVKDIQTIAPKDISKSLVILLSSTLSQITGLLGRSTGVDKVIITGNPFTCLEFMQMLQICTEMFSKKTVTEIFSEYSPYVDLIGMMIYLTNEGLINFTKQKDKNE